MKIQILTENNINLSSQFIINSFARPESFDSYDLNIIDLSGMFWRNNRDYTNSVNLVNDISHIKNMISTSSNKNILIALPQNTIFNYDYGYVSGSGNRYRKGTPLKGCLDTIVNIVRQYFIDFGFTINYEINSTTLNSKIFNSDFYFSGVFSNGSELNHADNSRKLTTFKLENGVVITTLNIFNPDLIETFLENSGYINNNIIAPEWFNEINILNDLDLKKLREETLTKLNEIEENIKSIDNCLIENNKYKSILYTTDRNLTSQVNLILSEIFKIEAEKFVDVYEEDFLIKLEEVTFVVEIKGVIHNVVGKNVTDALTHFQIYEDNITKSGLDEQAKCLLIVADQRLIKPEDRIPINERQITVASRNDILIIRTIDLLQIYEKYKSGDITELEIMEMFKNNSGLLKL